VKIIFFVHSSGDMENKPYYIELRLARISDLYLHEEIVESHLRKLKEIISRDGVLSNPVVVDRGSLVVLDGTHRVRCLEELGCRLITAVMVDYFDPMIRLRNWYRVISGDINVAIGIAKMFGFVDMEYDPKIAEEGVYDSIILIHRGGAIIYRGSGDIFDLYSRLRDYEEYLRRMGIKIEYIHENQVRDMLGMGKAVIVTPKLSKSDVIRVAKSGRVFPPKTTRHIFPIRPLFLDTPLELLRMDEVRDIESLINRLLLSRTYVKVKGPTIIDRFYDEDLLIVFM